MKDKTCCFTGHRKLSFEEITRLSPALDRTVRELIAKGITYFGTGGAIGFDTLAAQTVLRLRREFPHIRLILVLPCRNQPQGWSELDREVYEEILRRADKVVYIAERYTSDCMLTRNRHLVDHSGTCVYYLTHYGGGTGYTVTYAEKNGLTMIPLA